MAQSPEKTCSSNKTGAKWLRGKLNHLVEALGNSHLETVEIMTDVDQISELLMSLDDRRKGFLVNLNDAFGDL